MKAHKNAEGEAVSIVVVAVYLHAEVGAYDV